MATLKERARELKKQTSAVYLAFRSHDTPVYAKIAIALTIAYALSPIDLIPDFIPVLGYLDDVILLPLMIALCVKLIPKEVMDDCREKAEGMWQSGKPKKWYFAIPVILIWAALIIIIAVVIMNAISGE